MVFKISTGWVDVDRIGTGYVGAASQKDMQDALRAPQSFTGYVGTAAPAGYAG